MGYSSSNFFQICKLSLHYHDNLVGRILGIISNLTIIYGLIALTDKGDRIFMDLIENAKFNKGKTNFIKVLPVILLLLPVRHLLKMVMKVLCLLLLKLNSLTIMH